MSQAADQHRERASHPLCGGARPHDVLRVLVLRAMRHIDSHAIGPSSQQCLKQHRLTRRRPQRGKDFSFSHNDTIIYKEKLKMQKEKCEMGKTQFF